MVSYNDKQISRSRGKILRSPSFGAGVSEEDEVEGEVGRNSQLLLRRVSTTRE
jgi:hypothetical protein